MATEAEKVRTGLTAAAILADPLSVQIWSQMEADLMNAWRQTGPMMTAEREAIWHQMQALKVVKGKLESMAAVGRDADTKLQKASKNAPGIPEHYRLT